MRTSRNTDRDQRANRRYNPEGMWEWIQRWTRGSGQKNGQEYWEEAIREFRQKVAANTPVYL